MRSGGAAVKGNWEEVRCLLPPRLSIQQDLPPTGLLDGRQVLPAKPAGSDGDGRCCVRVGRVSRSRPLRPQCLTHAALPDLISHFCPCPAAEDRTHLLRV